ARSLTSSSEPVPIAIWADFGDEHAPREAILASSTVRANHQARTASRLHTVTSKVTRWLDARGFQTFERGIDSPVITADVPARALAELRRPGGVALGELQHPPLAA